MLAALFSVLLVASETVSGASATPQSPVTNETGEPQKKICKRQPVTGQIQGTKRICMTAEQWKRVQEADQRRR